MVMKNLRGADFLLLALLLSLCPANASPSSNAPLPAGTNSYAGSASCRECHERFYKLWSSSFHGLAMQPYTPKLAKEKLSPQQHPLTIDGLRYLADIKAGVVVEKGKGGEQRYPIDHVMGGKNVYYFLTKMDKGRLQTLPVAYDIQRKEWLDTALSGVRHFPGQQRTDAPRNWKEWPYTFNVACHDCHVSQLSNSFDQKSGSFSTSWKEPGINCETCHGPSDEHNRLMRSLPKGEKPDDYRIIRTKPFTPEQHNDSCNSCHSKMAHLTDGYRPGEPYLDHFDLVTLEDRDFYPDGRDLGENYTQTSWRLSSCVRKSSLNCITCHTSSGRYRFRKVEDSGKACSSCHKKQAADPAAHSHHQAGTAGARCVSCHMPTTEFARMRRTDHSMRPPAPAATIAFGSPNACNGCHSDRDAIWADRKVREWQSKDYQTPILLKGGLVQAARNRDWSKLGEIKAYLEDSAKDEIFAASLVRLFDNQAAQKSVPLLLKLLQDPSPLVRASAADGLAKSPTPEVLKALLVATADPSRLVRVMTASALSPFPEVALRSIHAEHVNRATEEYLTALRSRPISWAARYNLGNYYLIRSQPKEALAEYQAALRYEPKATLPMVNSAIAHAQMGELKQAEKELQRAITTDPKLAVAHYNLGLFKVDQDDQAAAAGYFKEAFAADPGMADAAYRLCLINGKDRPEEALSWCRKAIEAAPEEPNYAYTLAVWQRQWGDDLGALKTLQQVIMRHPGFTDAYLLKAAIHLSAGENVAAAGLYRQLLSMPGITDQQRRTVRERLDGIGQTFP
jgi:Tfp pilus assembly protein PilF